MYRFDEYDPACRNPSGAITAGQALGVTFRYRRGKCTRADLTWKIDGGEEYALPMEWQGLTGAEDVFYARLTPPGTGLYWYWFRVEAEGGVFVIDRGGPRDTPDEPYQLTVYDGETVTPDWVKSGVMYHIFVDRFACGGNSKRVVKAGAVQRRDWGGTPVFLPDRDGIVRNNDFFGGNLEGVIEKLPYLSELGVTCLYLSPVFEAASNHKYDTGDYTRIDAGFGDEDALAALIREAGARGMRVILDGVFSHTGADSVYFNKFGNYGEGGAYNSKDSPYYPWFRFLEWPDDYDSWWGIDTLPVVDKREPSYQEFITGEGGVIERWMKFGVAGWRLDVADELPDVFLDKLCGAARRVRPDAFIAGEVWEDASHKIAYGVRRRYFLGGQLDSVTNYPIRTAIIEYLREGDAEPLAATMAAIAQNYPKPVLDALMNILGTHDTMRVLTALGGEDLPRTKEGFSRFKLTAKQRERGVRLLKIASLLQFTLPGFPCVYYGDEAGMEGGADPFNRACYPWGAEDRGLAAWYHRLGEIRSSLPAFRGGAYRLVLARGGVFVFTRGDGDGTALIAANAGAEDVILPIKGFIYERMTNTENAACVVPAESAAIFTKGRP